MNELIEEMAARAEDEQLSVFVRAPVEEFMAFKTTRRGGIMK